MSEEMNKETEAELIKEAKKKALRLLEFSDRTEKQLRDKLKEGEFPPFAVEKAIEYVKSFHYIDDQRFAENYVRNRASQKSRSALSYELREKGVDASIVSVVLDEAELSGSDTVKTLFKKKYGHKDLSDQKLYEKAFRYFAGKGFSYGDTKKGIEEAISEIGADVDNF